MPDDLHFGKLKLPEGQERKIVLIASVIGVAGLFWLYKKGATVAGTNVSGTTTPPTTDTTTTPGVGGGSSTAPAPLPAGQGGINAVLSFSTDNSGFLSSSGSSQGAKAGSGGLNFGLFSIGGGGGTSSSSTNSFVGQNTNTFNSSVTLENVDAGTLANTENWLTKLTGTSYQREGYAIASQQNLYPFVSGNQTITQSHVNDYTVNNSPTGR